MQIIQLLGGQSYLLKAVFCNEIIKILKYFEVGGFVFVKIKFYLSVEVNKINNKNNKENKYFDVQVRVIVYRLINKWI